ncbi:MAG TPA: ABC transporter ATP-binding protein [Steroidobacteraceae bacterium]|nr:ABC transporter ATP-binding protein [Steroidobacteraceae bacterium]
MTNVEPAVAIHGLEFGWRPGAPILALESFEVGRTERVFLRGASGSGKSTLLGLIGGVLEPDAGRVRVLGQDLAGLSRAGRDQFRASHVGFIFQMFNLIPYLSVLDNVLLPARFSRVRAERAIAERPLEAEARRLLAALGLDATDLLGRSVLALSHGQQQRVAAARALFGRPELVIADEPTSALDADLRTTFLALLNRECQAAGAALLFVSHDTSLAPLFDRTVAMAELNAVTIAESGA